MGTDRKLFGSYEIMKDFINHNLETTQILEREWSAKYIDKNTGIEWLEYVADDRSCTRHLIQINPPLSTTDLIDIALNSPYQDESQAAIQRLIVEENTKEYRLDLLGEIKGKISDSLNSSEEERIVAAITQGDLLSKSNKKDIIGKPYTEVQKDYEFYSKIASEASKILTSLK